MRIVECIQYSPEWWNAKRGIASASNADRIITPKNGALSAQSIDYACELVAERMMPGDYWLNGSEFQSQAMANGSAREDEARSCYQMERDIDVQVVGFCLSDCGRFGCSPDWLIGTDGGSECKCPTTKVHARYLYEGVLPIAYKPQVHFSLAVTGRKYWDFYSYAPGLPPFCIRVEPDDYTEAVRNAMEEFWALQLNVQDRLSKAAA